MMSERMSEREFDELLIRRTNRDGTAERLCSVAHAEITTRLTTEVAWHVEDKDKWQDTQAAHLAEITTLRAENFSLASWQCVYTDGKTGLVLDEHGNQYCAMAKMVEALRAENERLLAALHEAADELDACYRAEYCGDHPYAKRKLAEAMRQNPARIAITQENKND